MALVLRPFSPLDGEREWQFLQELESEVNGFYNDGNGVSREDFPAFLLERVKMAHRVDLPENRVAQVDYWLCEEEKILGVIKIRTALTTGLLENGGNVGYAIHPDYRGKGYGKKMLALALEKARLKGLDTVLITCHQDNTGSRGVIEANGGRLWKESEKSRWYWITL
ncbi:MAG: GNAT family N-acetyltransferase [Spirochaetales bacterium]|nr:GNAT family N-acetyltransferase [Spirochaetales bacterium]